MTRPIHIRQFELWCEDGSRLVCWLDDDQRLKLGTKLTLEETGERVWRVTYRYRTSVSYSTLNRAWRVGGLL